MTRRRLHGRPPQGPVPSVDGFRVVERTYGDDDAHPTVGLANLHAVVPGVERNKEHIVRAARVFAELGVNLAVFPELCLSGYFWDDEPACRSYMETTLLEDHVGWLQRELLPLCRGSLRAIVLNGLATGPGGRLRNRTIVISPRVADPLDPTSSYDKVFLPGIEGTYTETGGDERLVVHADAIDAAFGFTTCYDYLFVELLRRYAFDDGVDAIVQLASWRAAASREYPGVNVRTDTYYGQLWDLALAAASAQNQVWTLAANAVGTHEISGAAFWGGSGIWAPSGIPLVQASNLFEELLIVHDLDLVGARRLELEDFDYEFDFRQVFRDVDAGAATETVD